MSLGRQIKELRIAARLSQAAMATELGWAQTAVSAYEMDKKAPSYVRLKQLQQFAKKYQLRFKLL